MKVKKTITKKMSETEAEDILASARRINTTVYQDGGCPARSGFYSQVWPGWWAHEADLYRKERGLIEEVALYSSSRILKSRFKKHGIEIYE